jgi:hypothetical protein
MISVASAQHLQPTPTFALVYRHFRKIADFTTCLGTRRNYLRQQKWKYGVLGNCALRRNLCATSFRCQSFYGIIKKPKANVIV